MIDQKTLKIYQNKGLPLVPEEKCSLYKTFEDPEIHDRGICDLDNLQVDIGGGCLNPENCSKLESREIKVVRLS